MKLAQYQKDQIRSAVVSEKFDPLFDALVKEKAEFARSLVASAALAVEGYPKDWFKAVSAVLCGFNGCREWLSFGENTKLHLPYRVIEHGFSFTADSAEYKLWHDLEFRKGQLEERRKELRAEINAVLKAVSTDKKLEEVWPEALKYLNKAPDLPATTDISRLKSLLETP